MKKKRVTPKLFGMCNPGNSHSLTFPVDLKLRNFSNGLRLCAQPIAEIEKLYVKTWSFEDVDFSNFIFPDELQGELFDIEITVEAKTILAIFIRGYEIICDPERNEIRIGACLFTIAGWGIFF